MCINFVHLKIQRYLEMFLSKDHSDCPPPPQIQAGQDLVHCTKHAIIFLKQKFKKKIFFLNQSFSLKDDTCTTCLLCNIGQILKGFENVHI